MFKLILLVIVLIAGVGYALFHWESFSGKVDQGIDTVQEIQEQGDKMHEKLNEVRDQVDEAVDQIKP